MQLIRKQQFPISNFSTPSIFSDRCKKSNDSCLIDSSTIKQTTVSLFHPLLKTMDSYAKDFRIKSYNDQPHSPKKVLSEKEIGQSDFQDVMELIKQLDERNIENSEKINEKIDDRDTEDDDSDAFGLLEAEENSIDDMFDFLFEECSQKNDQYEKKEDTNTSSSDDISSSLQTSSSARFSTTSHLSISSSISPSILSNLPKGEASRKETELEENVRFTENRKEDDEHIPNRRKLQTLCSDSEVEEDEEIVELFSTSKSELLLEMNEEKDLQKIKRIENEILVDWFPRLIEYMTKYTEKVLRSFEKEFVDGCILLFERQMKSKPEELFEINPEIHYNVLAAYGSLQMIYSGLCLSLIVSPCSESSCERVISKMKNII
ncbi:uncharacterized protein MONOS_17954 [Monocercomonoides exilis]|uniref:uncharacterized protein n=1 Tax=Monocercomonoides exilis TaxID=2049356 RepID=UPI00355A414C|nr:hypothetical protein MONOS_17954 [Monocercomonoides exilis]